MEHSLNWLSSDGFMPHGHCYLWTPELLWTYVISESVIVLAYFTIPFGLLYFVSQRKDLQFNWIFKLFSLFIFACGATHLMGIVTIWHPYYWLDALTKALTAIVSLIATIMLWRLIPRALKIPSTKQLEETIVQLEQEVAQRKAAETELEKMKASSDERFRILFEQAAEGVAEIDSVSGNYLRINHKYAEILGFTQEEMHHVNHHSIMHPDDLPLFQEKIRGLMENKLAEFSVEERFLHKDGHIIWVNLTISPMKKEGDWPLTHIAIVQDITLRKQKEIFAQEQLEELQRWHKTTLGREMRMQELKNEVNELLQTNNQPPRYVSIEHNEPTSPASTDNSSPAGQP